MYFLAIGYYPNKVATKIGTYTKGVLSFGPASISPIFSFGFFDNLLANVQPAEPAPTIMISNFFFYIFYI